MNFPAAEEATITLEQEQDTITDTNAGAKVILFNDEVHSFDQVIIQLIKAIHCTHKVADEMAMTVHTAGKCDVYHGAVEDCLNVSAILEEIELKTEIEFS